MKIWLSYVNYPITTATYVKRALEQLGHQVTTIGPRLPEEAISLWGLQNLQLPLTDQDIPTDFTPDMSVILARTPLKDYPDLYLWVESVNGYWPSNLDQLPCPKACWLIDSHVCLLRHINQAPAFDAVFLAQRLYVNDLRLVNPRSHWLPLACDPEVHRPHQVPLQHNLTFVGSLLPGTRRHDLLARLDATIGLHAERSFLDDMARTFSASRIAFNNGVQRDLNMRFFEVLSIGSLLLSDLADGSGQDELFEADRDYACYHDSNIVEVCRYYLENESIRLQVAARGQRLVRNAHTYAHRMEDLLNVMMRGKADTWSAVELRHRSLPLDEQISAKPSVPLIIGTPKTAIPLRLRSVITARAARPHPIIQTTVEWGEELAAHFGITRQDLGSTHYMQNQVYADNEVDFIFLALADDLRMFRHNRQLIPVVSDVWGHDIPDFIAASKGYPLVYTTSLNLCKQLNRLGHSQIRWMPFSVASCHLQPQPMPKQFDIIQYGRRNPVFDRYMEKLLHRHPHIHYVTTQADHNTGTYRIVSNLLGDLGPGNERRHFMEVLHACRISLVSTPGFDGEFDTGGIQSVPIRYYESIAAYCRLIARHKDDREFHLLGIEPFCHHADSYEQFEALVMQMLEQPLDHETTGQYREVQEMHTVRQRALQLAADLHSLAAAKRSDRV